jgi:dipeptidyl aminopeptidase/acylaminoacyl peptidase
MAVSSCSAQAAAGVGPSVTEVVEFTRLMAPMQSNEQQLRQQISPDGTRAFIVTRKANTRTDRNRYEILLLDLRPQRLAAGRYEAPVSVASLEPVVDTSSGYPSVQDLRWAGNRTILFRARLRDDVFQVFSVDTGTRVLKQLTYAAASVLSYAVSEDLGRVLYAAQEHNPPMPPGHQSIVVGNQSFWSVVHGQDDIMSQQRKFQYFVAERGNPRQPRRLGDAPRDLVLFWPALSISPDGRWALLPQDEPARSLEWINAYPLVKAETQRLGPGLLIDPLSYFTRPDNYVPMRLVAYRLDDGSARPVLDAPEASGNGHNAQFLWQAGGRSVVIAGTHLPLHVPGQTPGQVPASTAAHIVEYWPETGRWAVIAELTGRVKAAQMLSADAFMAEDEGGRREFRRLADGRWQPVAAAAEAAAAAAAPVWTLRIRQSLNEPPEIVAEGPAGQVTPLTRMNTQVTPAWGSMKPYSWKDAKGRPWNGGLLVPEGFQPGTRMPLVIQTYGFSPKNFYLDGTNLSEASTSGFAGRAFLRAGILVLAMPLYPAMREGAQGPREVMAASIDGMRGAIDALVQEGIVDRDRVGVMGFSTTAEWVLNLITFTDAPIRAASLLDGNANTFYSTVVTYAASDNFVDRKERTNGGMPAGRTLPAWLHNDPSMHADCIQAAVRIETYGIAVKNNWDIYSLLRRQYKAAEMVVLPRGSHALHGPGERLLSLQGNVDWYRFWLNGEERSEAYLPGESDETLREQYRQWRQMAALKKADDGRPVCARKAEGF